MDDQIRALIAQARVDSPSRRAAEPPSRDEIDPVAAKVVGQDRPKALKLDPNGTRTRTKRQGSKPS